MGLRTFTFGGTVSSAYDMFITDAAPYNAPERDVEMLSIPGRNGAFALDKGSFSNVEVTYHVVVYGSNHSGFQSELSDIRNWLCSAQGYQRLTDDYNPNEYRMAVYKGGLETKGDYWNGAEFDITFDCKPQRWLTSGETAVSVTSGDTLTNPTLFEASPELQVWGYGDITLGSNQITLGNVLVGDILISSGGTSPIEPDYSSVNPGDGLTIEASRVWQDLQKASGVAGGASCINPTVTWTHGSGTVTIDNPSGSTTRITANVVSGSAVYGTASTLVEVKVSGTFHAYDSSMNVLTAVYEITLKAGINSSGVLSTSASTINKVSGTTLFTASSRSAKWGAVYADSSKSALGTPTYIDLDIGEAYYMNGADVVSANSALTLGGDIPVLPSGATAITYDNTITQLKVVPRWWKV